MTCRCRSALSAVLTPSCWTAFAVKACLRGEYRRIPNWIGPPGCTIDDVRFVPIASDLKASCPVVFIVTAIEHSKVPSPYRSLD